MLGLHVVADDFEDARAVAIAGEGNVEIADFQFKQTREQLGVVHLRAVRGIAIAARTGVNPESLALVGGKSRQGEVVEIDEAVQQLAGRIDLIANGLP